MIKIILFLILLALLHALWEIQIEGKDGWAKKLPCWRINVFFRKLFGGKPMTGYHFYMFSIWILAFHVPYILLPYSYGLECYIWSALLFYFPVEDFLWFVCNKHYGIKKFKQGKVEWHKKWLLGLPKAYWICWSLSIILYLLPKAIQ